MSSCISSKFLFTFVIFHQLNKAVYYLFFLGLWVLNCWFLQGRLSCWNPEMWSGPSFWRRFVLKDRELAWSFTLSAALWAGCLQRKFHSSVLASRTERNNLLLVFVSVRHAGHGVLRVGMDRAPAASEAYLSSCVHRRLQSSASLRAPERLVRRE